jgi:cation diffusion facilitator CzcD-associated flavoprotein CzcO
MSVTEVAIVGAGPYGLAVAAALRHASIDHRVMGDPMSFWREMPKGMLLRSNWTATSIADYRGPVALDAYLEASGQRFGRPVPIERFIEYGAWVQRQVAPDVDRRTVTSVERNNGGFRLRMDDGDQVSAGRVVVAAGIAPFARRPAQFDALPADLGSHTSMHRDMSRFAGKRVIVVGGGQSALEAAALMHEAGTDVEVLVRKDHLNWLHGGKYHRMLGRWAPLVYAPTDVGPMGLSRIVAVPDLFRRLPRSVQEAAARRSIRPAGALWLVDRLRDVPITTGCSVVAVSPTEDGLELSLSDGGSRRADHVLLATGYRVDISRAPFLSRRLLDRISVVNGQPRLSRSFESSVSGLHFVGASSAWSYGPLMRFVAGTEFTAPVLARGVAARLRRG